MNTGTSRASARRKSDRHLLDVGIALPQRIGRLHQRRAERAAEHRLDLLRGRGDDRLLGLRARRIDHRLADDADAHALQRARRRRRSSRGSRRACSAPTSAARSCRDRADRSSPRPGPSAHRAPWRSRRSCGSGCRCGRNRCRRRWRRRRSRASPCAAGSAPPRCGWTGPRQDARVSSPRLAITRLALTDSAEPELEPSEAERVVS